MDIVEGRGRGRVGKRMPQPLHLRKRVQVETVCATCPILSLSGWSFHPASISGWVWATLAGSVTLDGVTAAEAIPKGQTAEPQSQPHSQQVGQGLP